MRSPRLSLLRALHTHAQLRGPLNVTAPQPVTNAEFSQTLGRVLHRPTLMRVPGFALKLALGEMSEVVLGGQRVLPQAAEAAGYAFQFPELTGALENLLR